MSEVLKFKPNGNETRNHASGARIIVEYLEERLILTGPVGEVEEHEGGHAAVAYGNGTGIVKASAKPNGPIGGFVLYTRVDLVATAASKHRTGNGGDKQIVASQGGDFSSLGSIAESIEAQYATLSRAVAVGLTRNGELSGREIYDMADKIYKGEKIRVKIVRPDGVEEVEDKRVRPEESITITITLPEVKDRNNRRSDILGETDLRKLHDPKTDRDFNRDLREAA